MAMLFHPLKELREIRVQTKKKVSVRLRFTKGFVASKRRIRKRGKPKKDPPNRTGAPATCGDGVENSTRLFPVWPRGGRNRFLCSGVADARADILGGQSTKAAAAKIAGVTIR